MASEVERIGEESRRYSAQMVERMAEAKARRQARSRELAEQSAAEMREFWQEMADSAAERSDQGNDRPVGADGQGDQTNEQSRPRGRQPEAQPMRVRRAENQRLREAELRGQQEAMAPSPIAGVGMPVHRGHEDERPAQVGQLSERDQRRAIARSAAARRGNDVVAPIDDDGDDEAEYYRRKSWLV